MIRIYFRPALKPDCPTSASSLALYARKAVPRTQVLERILQSYRNLGIFQENVVNQVLEDVAVGRVRYGLK